MKKNIFLLSLGSIAACTALVVSLVSMNRGSEMLNRTRGTDDFYSITINPEDVTTSSEYVDGNFSVETDQLHNPINLRFTQAGRSGDDLALAQNGEGKIFNYIGENSEVRGMNSITVKGGNTSVLVRWGYKDGSSIDYINYNAQVATPAGTEFSFSDKKPNYFSIESGSASSPSLISQIIIKYGTECEAGVNPNPTINGIRYGLRNGDHWAVEGFSGDSFANVTLEDEINGMPVTEIWSYAFLNNTVIESINLKNIVTVRTEAFRGCSNLTNIGDYSNITTYENSAFRNCDGLSGTLSFTAPNVYINGSTFHECDGITAVRFEDGSAVEMGSAAFRDMKELISVYIGDSVRTSDDFLYDPKLATITASDDNDYYTAIDNVLYEKNNDKLSLIRMAPARTQKSYMMPSNVTYMSPYCCHGCTSLESLVVNNSVERIPDDAFYGCTSLASVDFGSVQEIGNYAFCSCIITEITLPSSIVTVYGRAFISCNRLQSVIFEEGCTRIAHDAFYSCDLLSTLILPASLDYAGSFEGGYGEGALVSECPSLAAICTKLTSGEPVHAHANWLGDKTLLYYSDVENNDGAHWHEVGSDDAPRIWTDKLYIQSNSEFSADGTWYAVWAWTKGDPSTGAFYYDSNAPVNYLYSITVPTSKNCFIILRMKSGVDAGSITTFPDGQFFNRTDDLENVLADQITITQWDNGMGHGNLGISYSLHVAA